jgi:uncharacterized protein YlxW (UPF0749 family)
LNYICNKSKIKVYVDLFYANEFEVVMHFLNRKILLLISLTILGILIGIQLRSTYYINVQKTPTVKKIEQLKEQINEEKDSANKLKAQYDLNEKTKEENLKSAVNDKNDVNLKLQLDILEDAKLKAGLTNVKGAGIIVTLDDALVKMDADPKWQVIHAPDVVGVLNELKVSGAEALSINDERVIATSELVCAGPTLLINKNRYAVPFEIKAIGDPDTLYDSITKCESVYMMQRDKIRVEVTKSKEVIIPKFANNLDNLISALEENKK